MTRHATQATHSTKVEMEEFRARATRVESMARVAGHLSSCRDCRQEYAQMRAGSSVAGTLSLSWNSWLASEHLEYEQKRSYADGLMDVDNLEVTERHLELCRGCRDDLAGFVADRRANEIEFSRRQIGDIVSASSKQSFRRLGGLWSPLRAAALISLALGLAGLAGFRIADRNGWIGGSRTLQPGVEQDSGPRAEPSIVASIPGPGAKGEVPDDSLRVGARRREGAPSGLRMSLNDRGRQLVLESRMRGLTGANDSELDAITSALVTEEISLPQVIADLWGAEGSLRGPRRAVFELLRPRREVVRDAQPVFRWAALKDAEGYEVFVADSRHATVLTSGRLGADVQEWRPPVPLVRGGAYSWTVSALVRGEELISPTPADSEWKFRILSEEDQRELAGFEARTESHLARGILYARLGLITEAEGELQKLLNENPHSGAVRKLLGRVQSWR